MIEYVSTLQEARDYAERNGFDGVYITLKSDDWIRGVYLKRKVKQHATSNAVS